MADEYKKNEEPADNTETLNFAEIVRNIEEKTPLDTFYDHSQDSALHLTENEKMWIAQIPLIKSSLDELIAKVNGKDEKKKKRDDINVKMR